MTLFIFYNLGKGVSSLFSNFGTAWAIFKIQSAKLVRISPKYPLLCIPVGIPTKTQYNDTSGHTVYTVKPPCLGSALLKNIYPFLVISKILLLHFIVKGCIARLVISIIVSMSGRLDFSMLAG